MFIQSIPKTSYFIKTREQIERQAPGIYLAMVPKLGVPMSYTSWSIPYIRINQF
jgi:hypothetical protein